MAILAAATSDPSVVLRQRSDLLSAVGPIAQLLPYFQELVSSVSVFLLVRTWLTAGLAITSLSVVTKITVWQALLSRFLAAKSAVLTMAVSTRVWNLKACRRLRKKARV